MTLHAPELVDLEIASGAGGADREALHAATEGTLVRGFDEKVQMVVLNREVEDAEVLGAEQGSEDATDRAVGLALAQRRAAVHAQRHVHRMAGR